ncbi:MAG TPA: MFS transporter [Armatimonadota bacterium]|jgi:MFS family permease
MTTGATPAKRGTEGLPATVLILGLVSLLIDIASEMVYPILPVFLTVALGASPMAMGSIEAGAEAIPSLLKGMFGRLADKPRRRKPLAVAGYGLSALGKGVLVAATGPMGVLASRWMDRVGKGVRTAPRDAIIAAVAPKGKAGKAFGVHRAMDSAGAAIGPLLAFLFLRSHAATRTADFRLPFMAATVFAVAGTLVLAFFVKDVAAQAPKKEAAPKVALPSTFWVVLIAGTVFSLGNSSDTFLLLRTSQLGVSAATVALIWALYSAVYSVASIPLGALSDRIGAKRVLAAGYVIFAGVYLSFAFVHDVRAIWGLWAVYGLYIAATDGVQKALVARVVGPERRASAYGVLGMFTGVAVLPASLMTGWLYTRQGPAVAFGLSSALAVLAAVVLATVRLKEAV